MNKIIKIIKNPSKILLFLDNHRLIKLSDKFFLRLMYKNKMGKKLNLDNPQTFNEKLQWLKLNDRKEIYTTMVDKYEVKDYVSNIIGDEYIIPTLGVYNSWEEINFDALPKQFVIKCTHDSGGLVICKNKNNLDIKNAKKRIDKCLNNNYYYNWREWPYKNVKPRIIVEKYIQDNNNDDLRDYKFFCFNGEPMIVLVCSERFSSDNMCETWFDANWNLLDITEDNHRTDNTLKKPINFEKMKEFSRKLSKDKPFIRVDFYEVNNKVYFGELTFYPSSGFEKFDPEEWDYKLGQLIDLKKVESNEE